MFNAEQDNQDYQRYLARQTIAHCRNLMEKDGFESEDDTIHFVAGQMARARITLAALKHTKGVIEA